MNLDLKRIKIIVLTEASILCETKQQFLKKKLIETSFLQKQHEENVGDSNLRTELIIEMKGRI